MTRVNSAFLGLTVGILLTALFFNYRLAQRKQPNPGANQFSTASSSANTPRIRTLADTFGGAVKGDRKASPVAKNSGDDSRLLAANLPYSKAAIEVEYREIFSRLNVPEDSRVAIVDALLSLWRTKVQDVQSGAPEAGEHVSDAVDAFLEKVALLLGERSAEYLAWETSTAARREYAHFEDFIRTIDGIAPDYILDSRKVLNAIERGGAYSWDPGLSVHPFESFKRPFQDTRQGMVERYQTQKDLLLERASATLATADNLGLDKVAADALSQYYAARAVKIDGSIERFTRDPKVNSLIRVEAELDSLRAQPASDVTRAKIAAAESQIASLMRAIEAQRGR